MLITFANSLDPEQAWQNIGLDLDPNCLTLWWYSGDADHSDFCGIFPFFKAVFRITILDVKIPQNNDFTSKYGTR